MNSPDPNDATSLSRRAFVAMSVAARPLATALAAAAGMQLLAPTPACGDDDDEPTPPQTEGPFYTPDTPARKEFVGASTDGERLTVRGNVLDTQGKPIPNALLDFWHADAKGVYDNEGYTFRGHQHADENGRFVLKTIVPGLYPGRTPHIHVKVQAPNNEVLTTQLYFPGHPLNEKDGIFNEVLCMKMKDKEKTKVGRFDFVLDV
jgi:protocatechuate 3,4-dioxygenase beta subunit